RGLERGQGCGRSRAIRRALAIPAGWLGWLAGAGRRPLEGRREKMAFEATDATRSFPTAPRGATRGLANWLKTGVLLAAMTALILVVGQAIGGMTGLLFAGVFALISNFAAFWWSDRLALAVHRARPLDR